MKGENLTAELLALPHYRFMYSLPLEFIAIVVSVAALMTSSVFSWIQVRNAERTRKLQIAPHVTAYTHTPLEEDVLFLVIENVGSGAARNVRAKAVKGGDFLRGGEDPLSRWRPLNAPIPVLPVNRPIQTVLTSPVYQDFANYSKEEIVIEIAFEDVEGKKFVPIAFPLDMNPNDGVTTMRHKTQSGGTVTEDRRIRLDFEK